MPLASVCRRGRLRTRSAGALERALQRVGLLEHAATPVGHLSGGQRKRASIAVELLTDPRIFFLDEPTSGLDPATGADLVDALRELAAAGAAVVFTTHAMDDLAGCDRVVFVGPGGRVTFTGSVPEALAHFGVASVREIYRHLSEPDHGRVAPVPATRPPSSVDAATAARSPRRSPGPVRQWWVLTQRTSESLVRNRLTLAILVGSPLMVVGMFAVLFQAGSFDVEDPSPTSILMIIFWITFGAFFFGLTYGLLQVVTERAVLHREHLVGLDLTAYLLSKVAVLLPFLVVVNVVMLVVLRALDRLPDAPATAYMAVCLTLSLDALAALGLGLLASAAVSSPNQATLVLPMLCFPAVLFSGAVLPVHVMATVGKWISAVVPVRWAFEAVGHDLEVRELLTEGGSPLGPPLVEAYGSAGLESSATYWTVLAAFSVFFLTAARLTLRRRFGVPRD